MKYIYWLWCKNNDKIPKFEVLDNVIISKYKTIFAKSCTPNWSEYVFVTKKVKNTVLATHVVETLNGEEIVGTLYEKKKKLQKANQTEFRIGKVIKKKGDKLFLRRKVITICLIAGLIERYFHIKRLFSKTMQSHK